MNKILLVYATREGQTKKVAHYIFDRLNASGAQIEIVNARDIDSLSKIDIKHFDLVVLGASMHAGGIEKEMRDFINKEAEVIKCIPRCFFLVLLSAGLEDEVARNASLTDANIKVRKQLSVTFDKIEMIAGALKYSQYPFPLRWLMKRISLKAGQGTDTSKNYEYTDWQQVDTFTDSLLAKCDPRTTLEDA